MNRRNFIGNLLLAGASFAILPGADRLWKARRVFSLNPDMPEGARMFGGYVFNERAFAGKWQFVSDHDIIHLDLEKNPLYRACFSPPTAMCLTELRHDT